MSSAGRSSPRRRRSCAKTAGRSCSRWRRGANKIEIKRAVEQLLGSKVESIRTSIAHGKIKRQGRFAGRRSDWKKAYVKLREGEKMPEFLEGA